jgi:excisionase family DNA binding protein
MTDILRGAAQIAEALGVCERLAYGLIQRGEIPVWRTGGRYETSRAALQQFYALRAQQAVERASAATK